MNVIVCFQDGTEPVQYLQACARIRDVSLTRMTQLLIDRIGEDKLVAAVLDDDGRHQRSKYEQRYRMRS